VRHRKVGPIPAYRQLSNPRVFLATFLALLARAVWVDDLSRPRYHKLDTHPWCRPLQG